MSEPQDGKDVHILLLLFMERWFIFITLVIISGGGEGGQGGSSPCKINYGWLSPPKISVALVESPQDFLIEQSYVSANRTAV